jgi:ArsR family transcriptional regulator
MWPAIFDYPDDRIFGAPVGTSIVSQLQSLADTTRSRLLLVLQQHEMTVGELCEALALPQSTVSRHLKLLADDGWVASRADGTSRLYRMVGELEPSARQLWQVVREQVGGAPAARRDRDRLRGVLAGRRARSDEFFRTAAASWDAMRTELFGARTELLPMLGLLQPDWTVGDLGCGTGQLTQLLAGSVRQVIAVDASEAMLRSARVRLNGLDNVEVRRGDLERLPLDDGLLDLGFVVLVLPYLPEPRLALAEAARVIRPGGRLLVADLMPHERDDYRQTMGHLWQGFAEDQMVGWMSEAGLQEVRYRPTPLEPGARGPMLFAAVGKKRDA